jgi:hypothetical protein
MSEEKKQWVDFKAVKEKVNMVQALQHYHLLGTWKQGRHPLEYRGACPFLDCTGKTSFSWSKAKNAFQCFKCKERGNVLDFVAKMESCSVRDAALKLAEWFQVESIQSDIKPPQSPVVEKTQQEESEDSNSYFVSAWVRFQNGEGRLIHLGPFDSEDAAKEWKSGFMQALLSMNNRPLWVIKAECEIHLPYSALLAPSEAVEILLKDGAE